MADFTAFSDVDEFDKKLPKGDFPIKAPKDEANTPGENKPAIKGHPGTGVNDPPMPLWDAAHDGRDHDYEVTYAKTGSLAERKRRREGKAPWTNKKRESVDWTDGGDVEPQPIENTTADVEPNDLVVVNERGQLTRAGRMLEKKIGIKESENWLDGGDVEPQPIENTTSDVEPNDLVIVNESGRIVKPRRKREAASGRDMDKLVQILQAAVSGKAPQNRMIYYGFDLSSPAKNNESKLVGELAVKANLRIDENDLRDALAEVGCKSASDVVDRWLKRSGSHFHNATQLKQESRRKVRENEFESITTDEPWGDFAESEAAWDDFDASDIPMGETAIGESSRRKPTGKKVNESFDDDLDMDDEDWMDEDGDDLGGHYVGLERDMGRAEYFGEARARGKVSPALQEAFDADKAKRAGKKLREEFEDIEGRKESTEAQIAEYLDNPNLKQVYVDLWKDRFVEAGTTEISGNQKLEDLEMEDESELMDECCQETSAIIDADNYDELSHLFWDFMIEVQEEARNAVGDIAESDGFDE